MDRINIQDPALDGNLFPHILSLASSACLVAPQWCPGICFPTVQPHACTLRSLRPAIPHIMSLPPPRPRIINPCLHDATSRLDCLKRKSRFVWILNKMRLAGGARSRNLQVESEDSSQHADPIYRSPSYAQEPITHAIRHRSWYDRLM